MNHCQLPGFVIYKLYTKNEIINRVKVKQEISDYPIGLNIDEDEMLTIDDDVFTMYELYYENRRINLDTLKFAKHLVSDIKRLYSGGKLNVFKYESADSDEDEEQIDLDYVENMRTHAYLDLMIQHLREMILHALRSNTPQDRRYIHDLRQRYDTRPIVESVIREYRNTLNEPESD